MGTLEYHRVILNYKGDNATGNVEEKGSALRTLDNHRVILNSKGDDASGNLDSTFLFYPLGLPGASLTQ